MNFLKQSNGAGKDSMITWNSLFKFLGIVGVIGTSVWHIEGYIRDVVTSTIDQRLENWIHRTEFVEGKTAQIEILQKKQAEYLVNNSYRLNYHEDLFRTTQRTFHRKFPQEFIKPEELRFDDYKTLSDAN